jgi:hypothetical protein
MEKGLQSMILKYLEDIKTVKATKKYSELISNEKSKNYKENLEKSWWVNN